MIDVDGAGVWVTHYEDDDGRVIIEAVWIDEISALRAANLSPASKAAFLPYGTEPSEAWQ